MKNLQIIATAAVAVLAITTNARTFANASNSSIDANCTGAGAALKHTNSGADSMNRASNLSTTIQRRPSGNRNADMSPATANGSSSLVSSPLAGDGAPSLSKLKWTALAQQKGSGYVSAPVKIESVNPSPEPATIAALAVAAASLIGRAGGRRNPRYQN